MQKGEQKGGISKAGKVEFRIEEILQRRSYKTDVFWSVGKTTPVNMPLGPYYLQGVRVTAPKLITSLLTLLPHSSSY
jgi:hypothetical protein